MLQIAVSACYRQPILSAELLNHAPRGHIFKEIFVLFEDLVFVFEEEVFEIKRIILIVDIEISWRIFDNLIISKAIFILIIGNHVDHFAEFVELLLRPLML